jgi:hypothetical protein
VKFLYGPDAPDRIGRDPRSIALTLTVDESAHSPEILNVFSAYTRFQIGLPLLDEDGDQAVGPIRVFPSGVGMPEGKTVIAPGGQLKLRWNLFARDADYPPTNAIVSGKARTAHAELPETLETPWTLPDDPWSLLLLIGSQPENRRDDSKWRVPLKIRVDADGYQATYAYDVIVQFEEGHLFPGPIPPLKPPSQRPKMASASLYLNPPDQRSGR